MKQLVLNYVKMIKCGFFYKTFLFSILLLIPSLAKATFKFSNSFIEIPIFFFEMFFYITLPFSIINNISENRYIFCLTLPIKISNVIKLAYVQTYLVYIFAMIGIYFISIFTNTALPVTYLLIVSWFLFSTNFIFPYISSPELAKGADELLISGCWIFLVVSIPILISLFILLLSNLFSPFYIFNGEFILILIIITLAALTLKNSYKRTLGKIMDI